MAFCNLFPVGIVQLYDAVSRGYWHARTLDFLMQRRVHIIAWARLPADVLFIAGGAVPLFILCLRALRYPNPARQEPGVELGTALYTEVE
jgi:nitric oxide reductase subunit B